MKKRSPVAVLLLPFVTFGIYSIYWLVKTKGEMKALGADIPTAWLIIVPLVNFWWYWKYCKGVEQVTNYTAKYPTCTVSKKHRLWLNNVSGVFILPSYEYNVANDKA
ncbi:DUF4234 domain-containing protein [bacterium]|nr:DUF4234 domain-containing protein [bacterium]